MCYIIILKHFAFYETHPEILSGELQNDGIERIYKTPAPDFQLSQLKFSNSSVYNATTTTAEVLISIEGTIEITEGEDALSLQKGSCAFLEAGSSYSILSKSNAIVYKATAP